MSKSKTIIKISAKTDKGMVRDHNEDDHIFCPDLKSNQWKFFENTESFQLDKYGSLIVVADGMGGMNAGEVASRLAKEGIQEYFSANLKEDVLQAESKIKSFMKNAILSANEKIVKKQKEDKETEGMGTTLIMAWIYCNKVYISWSGDSRCYRYNPASGLQSLSKDHSYVQELIDAGKITEEQAFYHPDSNIVSQSLGDEKHKPKPDFRSYDLNEGDRILLCSDGLNAMLQDVQIRKIFENNPEITACVDTLINETNEAGGHDNTTIIIAEVEKVGGAAIPAKNFKTYFIYAGIFIFAFLAAFLFFKYFNNNKSDNQYSALAQNDMLVVLKKGDVAQDTIEIKEGQPLLVILSDTFYVSGQDTFSISRITLPGEITNNEEIQNKQSEEPSANIPEEENTEVNIAANDLPAILKNITAVLKKSNAQGVNTEKFNAQNKKIQISYAKYLINKTKENKKAVCQEITKLIELRTSLNINSKKFIDAFAKLITFKGNFCIMDETINEVSKDSINNKLTIIKDTLLKQQETKEFKYDKTKDPNNSGLSPVLKNGKWGYTNIDGTLKIKCQYNKANYFGKEYAFVKTGNQWAVIDTEGKTIIAAQDKWGNPLNTFANGKATVISTKGDTICIDITNKLIDCK